MGVRMSVACGCRVCPCARCSWAELPVPHDARPPLPPPSEWSASGGAECRRSFLPPLHVSAGKSRAHRNNPRLVTHAGNLATAGVAIPAHYQSGLPT